MAGRPSNQEERYHQVMQAMVYCVARYGLDGATLDRIAKQANLSRPLIRHHLGNKEDMLGKLKSYVLDTFTERADSMFGSLPDTQRSQALLDTLFSDENSASSDLVMAFAALTARAAEDSILQQECRDWILGFEDKILAVLAADHADTDLQILRMVATGITAIFFNVSSLSALSLPDSWHQKSQQAAQTLLRAIGE
ncbi:transcriptional regulator BetI [Roseovarius albus]|uniref:Transcriptional regulator BetI n=1 Tax=Roseovarius albus TaxID=1247867 RepID=A0A1X6ZLX7_9RHOB|nr:TetR/AcrR family transcriptional regulator [Roseovarius albus]SLN55094.1 transcriptional regulator BetI [Roseovarius albus]